MSDMDRLLYKMSLSCERNNEIQEHEEKKEAVPAAKVQIYTDETEEKFKKEKANDERKGGLLAAKLLQEEIPSLGALVIPNVVIEKDEKNEKRKEQQVPAKETDLDNDVVMKEDFKKSEEPPAKEKTRCYYPLDDVVKGNKLIRKLRRAIRREEKKRVFAIPGKLCRNGGKPSSRENPKLKNGENQTTLPVTAVNRSQLKKVSIKNNKVIVSGIELLNTALSKDAPSTSNEAQGTNLSTSTENLQKAAMSTQHSNEQQTPTNKQESVHDHKVRIVKSFMMQPLNMDYYDRREERDYDRLKKKSLLYNQTKQLLLEKIKQNKMKLNLQQQEHSDSDNYSSRSPDLHYRRQARMQHRLKTQEQCRNEIGELIDRKALRADEEEFLRDAKAKVLRETNGPSQQSK